jgi:hypothetical protein
MGRAVSPAMFAASAAMPGIFILVASDSCDRVLYGAILAAICTMLPLLGPLAETDGRTAGYMGQRPQLWRQKSPCIHISLHCGDAPDTGSILGNFITRYS